MTGKVQWKKSMRRWAMAAVLVLTMGVIFVGASMDCLAQTKARVKVSSAKIREEASTASAQIGSANSGDSFDVTAQTQDGNGYTWYQITFDGSKKGYLRADTVDVSGDMASSQTSSGQATTGVKDIPVVEDGMEPVNPVSASVTGSIIKIRADVKTGSDSNVITKVQRGEALTVVGQKIDEGGKVWYLVNFAKEGKEISGYIRSDYAELSGEITPYVAEPEPSEEDAPADESEPEPEQAVVKDYDTQLDDGEWYIYDNINDKRQSIQGLFDAAAQNAAAYEKEAKKVKIQKAFIVILVLLLVAACGAAGFFFMKLKDAVDQDFFKRVEKDTISGRNRAAGQKNEHRISRSGVEGSAQRRKAGQGVGPAGAGEAQRRPAGPGARPAGAGEAQRRPAGPGARPAGVGEAQRRPVVADARPAEAAEAQRRSAEQAQKAVEREVESNFLEEEEDWFKAPIEQDNLRPARPAKEPARKQEEWKAKNFLAEEDDEDEFEFGFFNMQEDDEI